MQKANLPNGGRILIIRLTGNAVSALKMPVGAQAFRADSRKILSFRSPGQRAK